MDLPQPQDNKKKRRTALIHRFINSINYDYI